MPEIKVGQIWGSTYVGFSYMRRTILAVVDDDITYKSWWVFDNGDSFFNKSVIKEQFLDGSVLLSE